LITHLHPHLDEYLAEYIARKFGILEFHFTSNFQHHEITCAGVGNVADGQLDSLFIGVGGGPFDDHGRNSGYSSAELMVQYLGLEDDPRLITLIRAVTIQDKQGKKSKDFNTLPIAINNMHRYGYSSDEIRQWVFQAFDSIIESEALLLDDIKQGVSKTVMVKENRQAEIRVRFLKEKRSWFYFQLFHIATLMGESGKDWNEFGEKAFQKQAIAFRKAKPVAKSHCNLAMTRFGEMHLMVIDGSAGQFSEFEIELDSCSRINEVGADVVLLRNSRGHTLVSANKKAAIKVDDFYTLLCQTESESRGKKSDDVWYKHEGVSRIYNGTLTRPDVDFTELEFEEIKSLLFSWLEVRAVTVSDFEEGVDVATAFDKTASAG